MYHKLYKVIGFKIIGHYVLQVQFDDHTEQIINFEPVLHGEMWGPLRDLGLFNQVAIDPIAKTLSWPNGADFDAETLRNWSEYCEELAGRAQTWDRVFA